MFDERRKREVVSPDDVLLRWHEKQLHLVAKRKENAMSVVKCYIVEPVTTGG